MRPVRPLALGRPLVVEGMRIRDFLVRVRDHAGAYKLPDTFEAQADEVVVVAPGRTQPPRFLLVLGLDQLTACSSVTYVRRAVRLVARCTAD